MRLGGEMSNCLLLLDMMVDKIMMLSKNKQLRMMRKGSLALLKS
jgi:hypothetical protein